ncbi:MAG: tight adherence protein [Actinomycetota bacterium]|jgi:tight adherence protein C|nr:tight adherence protein [Actinomycetota bacterium]
MTGGALAGRPLLGARRALLGAGRVVTSGRRAGGGGRWDDGVALTADLLAVAVAAGLTPYLAVEVAARFSPEPVAGPLQAAMAAARAGQRLADALGAEAVRTPAMAPLLALLVASERSGAPVGAALGRLAVSTRAQARRRAMARARTVPVRLLFPLVFLALPAFLLLTVAPVVLATLAH